MIKNNWIEEISVQIPEIQDIVDKCKPEFQQACFEILLKTAVNKVNGGSTKPSVNKDTPEPNSDNCDTDNVRFSCFLEKHDLTTDHISAVIDIESGHILTRKSSGAANSHRIIASLLAVKNLASTGDFSITKKEVIQKCKEYGIRTENINRDLKSMNKKYIVFQETPTGWKVNTRGEEDIAKIIIGLSS